MITNIFGYDGSGGGGMAWRRYVALVFWMCFTAALFVAEHNDKQMAGSVSQAWRFSSMTHSLQYDAILLSGDYPLVDFTVMGKLVNIAQAIPSRG